MITWLSPGDPSQRTGGYLWNARLVEVLRREGRSVDVLALPGAWPRPEGGVADALLAGIPDGAPVVADGLLWPGLGDAGRRLAARCPVTVVVHSLLARETGVADPDGTDAWERASWAGCRALVATSADTARRIGDPRVVVVQPGTARAERARGGDGRTLLCVATLTRRKGHDVLLRALASVRSPWRLRCAGAARDPAWARVLGDPPGVVWLGDLDGAALDAEYARADVVVQAAHYESYGMAIAEAVARGLPVITRPAGAVDHLPPGAVRVVDEGELGAAIDTLLGDPEARRAQAERAWAAREALPTWEEQARRLIEVAT